MALSLSETICYVAVLPARARKHQRVRKEKSRARHVKQFRIQRRVSVKNVAIKWNIRCSPRVTSKHTKTGLRTRPPLYANDENDVSLHLETSNDTTTSLRIRPSFYFKG